MKYKTNPIFQHRFAWLYILFLAGSGLILGIYSILMFERASILIEWTTASEVDIAGYNLLRGEAKDGPYLQVNDQLILPAEDPLVGGHYTFKDEEVQAGKIYTYVLEDVEITGEKNRHGPITQKAENNAVVNLLLSGLLLLSALLFAWRQGRKPDLNRDDAQTGQMTEGPQGNG